MRHFVAASIFVLTAIVFLLPLRFYNLKNVPCADFKDAGLIVHGDLSFTCFRDRAHNIWWEFSYKSLDKDVSKPNAWIEFSPEVYPNGLTIELTSILYNLPTSTIGDAPFVKPGLYASTGDGNSITVRRSFTKDEVAAGAKLASTNYYAAPIRFYVDSHDADPTAVGRFVPSRFGGGSSYLLYTMLGLLLASIVVAIVQYQRTPSIVLGVAAITAAFLLGNLTYERPYRGMSGFIDGGDDTYYVAYAQTHLQSGDLFKCNTRVQFSDRQVRCFGFPGTAIALEPGIILSRWARGTTNASEFLDLSDLIGMRITSAYWAFFAMLLLFLTIHLWQPSALGILLAISILWCTSLSKWAFERSIFSHTPEMGLLVAWCLTLTLLHRRKLSPLLGAAIASAINGMIILVRAEYMMLPALIPWLLVSTDEKVLARSNLKKVAIYAVVFVPFYWTMNWMRQFMPHYSMGFVMGSFADLTNLAQWAQYFRNIKSIAYGLSVSGFLVPLGFLGYLWLLWKKRDGLIAPLGAVLYMGFYFAAIANLTDPLGMEWGVRYLLKLSPVAVLGVASLYHTVGGRAKVTILAATLASFVMQHVDYLGTLQSEMVRYEPFFRFLSDSHWLSYGYHGHHYTLLKLNVVLFCVVTLSLFIASIFWLGKNRADEKSV